MRTAALIVWLLAAMSAHTLLALAVVFVSAPFVYAWCVKAGEIR